MSMKKEKLKNMQVKKINNNNNKEIRKTIHIEY